MKRIIQGTRNEFKNFVDGIRDENIKGEKHLKSSDVLSDLSEIESNTVILDKRDGKILEILSPREAFVVTDLIRITKLQDHAEMLISLKLLASCQVNYIGLLVFLSLFKDELCLEAFELLTTWASTGNLEWEKDEK